MEFTPASQNGITPPTELKTWPSQFALAISTTATYVGRPVILKAISDAAMYKTEPVTFFSEYTTGTTTSTIVLGTSSFINTAVAPLVLNSLSTGSHRIWATWPGEGRYAGVSTTSTPIAVEISPGVELGGTFAVAASPASGTIVVGEGTATFTATFSTSTVVPGNVIFFLDNVQLGSVAIIDNQATFRADNIPAGNHTITAQWPGATIGGTPYRGEIYTFAYNILRGTTVSGAMTLSIDPTPGVLNEGPVRLTANINTSTQLPGNVTFYIDGAELYTVALANNSATTLINNVYSTGTYQVSAVWDGNQSGHPRYIEKATTSSWTIVEKLLIDNISFTFSPNPAAYTEDVTFTATITAPSLVAGDILFYDNNFVLARAPIINNVATYTTSTLTTGTHELYAYYPGSLVAPKYAPASSAVTTTEVAAGLSYPPIQLSFKGNAYRGTGAPFIKNEVISITASVNTSTPVVGPATFYVDGIAYKTSTWVNNSATTTASFTASSTYAITAGLQGTVIDGIPYLSQRSTATNLVIQDGYNLDVPINLNLSTSTQIIYQPMVLTASITTSSLMSGTMEFYVVEGTQTTFINTASLSANSAAIATNFITTGTKSVYATLVNGRMDGFPYLSTSSEQVSLTIVSQVKPSVEFSLPTLVMEAPIRMLSTITNTQGFDVNNNTVTYLQESYAGDLGTTNVDNNQALLTTSTYLVGNPTWRRKIYARFNNGNGFVDSTSSVATVEVMPYIETTGTAGAYAIGSQPGISAIRYGISTTGTTSSNDLRLFASLGNSNATGTAVITYKGFGNTTFANTVTVTQGVAYTDIKLRDIAYGLNPVTINYNGRIYSSPLNISKSIQPIFDSGRGYYIYRLWDRSVATTSSFRVNVRSDVHNFRIYLNYGTNWVNVTAFNGVCNAIDVTSTSSVFFSDFYNINGVRLDGTDLVSYVDNFTSYAISPDYDSVTSSSSTLKKYSGSKSRYYIGDIIAYFINGAWTMYQCNVEHTPDILVNGPAGTQGSTYWRNLGAI